MEGDLSKETLYIYEICFRHFISCVGDKLIRLVTVIDVETFKKQHLKKVTPVRVNMEFRTLKAAFNRAVKWKMIETNPFEGSRQIAVPERNPVYLTKEDFRTLLEAERDSAFRNLFTFAVSTMMRLGEIVFLEWSDVDLDRRTIQVKNKKGHRVKGGRSRIVPISERVYYLLMGMERRSRFVFSKKDDNPLCGRSVSRRFKKLTRRCGLSESVHFHSLRHTGASWLAQSGIPLFEIQRILGHRSPLVTQIYAHLPSENLVKAVDRIAWN